MKEIKHYVCEICHTEYNERQKAIDCEKKHCKPMAKKNCELELYKLIMEGASCGFPYVSEFDWVNDGFT